MKGHKLVKDHKHSFEIMGPDGQSFHVAKHQLSLPMMVELAKLPKHLSEGDEVDDTEEEPSKLAAQFNSGPKLEDLPEYKAAQALKAGGWEPHMPVLPIYQKELAGPPAPPTAEASNLPDTGINVAALNPSDIGPQGESREAAATAPATEGLPGQDYLTQLQGVSAQEKAGLGRIAGAETQYSKEAGDIIARQDQKMAELDAKSSADLDQLNARNDKLMEAISKGSIDPGRLWHQGFGNTIGMIAAALVGGYGQGLAGGKNMGVEAINQAIDRDIDAQKADLGRKTSLLNYNMHRYGNLVQAQTATKMQMLAGFKSQLEVAALKKGSTEAQARAQIAGAQIDQQYTKLANDFKLNNMRLASFGPDSASGGDGTPPTDAEGLPNPAFYGINMQKLRLGQAIQGIPEKEFASVMKDVGDYGKLKHTTDNLVEAFKKVDQEQDPTNRVVNFMQSKSSINKIEKEFSAQLAKDLEGRATPQDIDSIMENFPGLTDNAETRKLGLQNMMNSIKGKFGDLRNLQIYGLVHPHDPYLHTTSQTKSLADQAFRKVP